jgi:hypothetical protein
MPHLAPQEPHASLRRPAVVEQKQAFLIAQTGITSADANPALSNRRPGDQ